MADKAFKFELKQIVRLIQSGETGTVVGRAEYTNTIDGFLILYKAGDGRQVSQWWAEDTLEAA